MSTDAHAEHAHDDHGHDHGHGHGHADDHGHGHGAPVAWEIIPEDSGADRLLLFLCAVCMIGLLYFSVVMATTKEHEGGEKGAHSEELPPPGTEAVPSNEATH